MVELNTRHTGKYVKTKILEILAMYKIFLTQMFTVTCENGANMIATVNQLRSELQKSYDHPEDDDTFVVPIEQVEQDGNCRKGVLSYNNISKVCGAYYATLSCRCYNTI